MIKFDLLTLFPWKQESSKEMRLFNFCIHDPLIPCKKSEKSDEWFLSKLGYVNFDLLISTTSKQEFPEI